MVITGLSLPLTMVGLNKNTKLPLNDKVKLSGGYQGERIPSYLTKSMTVSGKRTSWGFN